MKVYRAHFYVKWPRAVGKEKPKTVSPLGRGHAAVTSFALTITLSVALDVLAKR